MPGMLYGVFSHAQSRGKDAERVQGLPEVQGNKHGMEDIAMTIPRRPNRRLLHKWIPRGSGACEHLWKKTDEDTSIVYWQCTICEKVMEQKKYPEEE